MVVSFSFGSSSDTSQRETERISWILPYGFFTKASKFRITSLHDFSGYASVLVFRHVSSCNGTDEFDPFFFLQKFASPLTWIRLLQKQSSFDSK